MSKSLVQKLDTSTLRGATLELLAQSLDACREDNLELMYQLARDARKVAQACRDPLAEAAALLHQGVVYTQSGQVDKAREAYERARRLYHRAPSREDRHNEALALWGLALTYPQDPVSQIKAVAHYQQALDVLERLRVDYVNLGHDRQARLTQKQCDELIDLIHSQIPKIYVEGEKPFPYKSPGVYRTPGKVGRFERNERGGIDGDIESDEA